MIAPTEAMPNDIQALGPALEAVPYAMLIVDTKGRIRSFNQEAQQLFGHGPEILGQPVETLIPAGLTEHHRQHRHNYAQAPRKRPMGSGQALRARRADGSQIQVEVSLNPIRLGPHDYVIASVRDVGPQRRAKDIQVRLHQQETLMSLWEQALRTGSSEDCMRDAIRALHELFSAMRVRLYELDTDRTPPRIRVLSDTRAAERPTWSDITSMAEVQDIYADEMRAAERRLPPVAAKMHQHEGEALLVLSLRSQGLMVGALSISLPRNVTFTRDQVYLAQNVSHLLASVLIRKRSDELLLVAAKMEALGQLSGGIAHDFNNLLSIIAGNLEILGDRVASDEVSRKLINVALSATRRGGELTKRLLLFARKRPPQVIAQHIGHLINELAEVLERALGERIEMRLDIPDDLPLAQIDPSVFDACLINLATNARDAMSEGGRLGIRVHVCDLGQAPPHLVSVEFHAGRFVAVEVSDTGEGMNEDVRQRAFDPFFTTKSPGRGTGLGLSLIRSLIMQTGGYVALDSTPDQGTRVTLYFPVAAAEPDTTSLSPPAADVSGRGERILIVEDEPAVRDTARLMIEDLGYRALTADSVAAVQDMLAKHPDIALVFSDIAIGRHGSGLDLREALTHTHPHLPVVLTSGYAKPMLERYGMDVHTAEVLGKPYSRAQLAEALGRALSQAAGR